MEVRSNVKVAAAFATLLTLVGSASFAQNDLSGEWANLLHEDVNHRNDGIGGGPRIRDYAAHTWQGFSTGHWEGAMLTVETTHVKAGWIQRNGVPSSDRARLVEHIVRHGDVLTLVSVVYDPIYLEEPLVRSTNWIENPTQQLAGVISEIVDEIADRPDGYVPHHLPGTNKWLKDAAVEFGIPEDALRGGRKTTYPEYRPQK